MESQRGVEAVGHSEWLGASGISTDALPTLVLRPVPTKSTPQLLLLTGRQGRGTPSRVFPRSNFETQTGKHPWQFSEFVGHVRKKEKP